MAEQKFIDLTYLKEITMDDDELIVEMIELFLENTPTSLSRIESMSNDQNWKKLAEEAHKLKPNLAYMGLNDTKKKLEEVESKAKNTSHLESIPGQIEQIQDVCSRAYDELQALLQDLRD